MSFGDGDLHDRVSKLETANARLCEEINRLTAENDELRGYMADLLGCLDEIYKPANIECVREIIDQAEYELGIEVER